MPRRRRLLRPTPRLTGHVTRDGRPKTAYRTRDEAEKSARATWSIERIDLDAYRCEVCHQWHIGRRWSSE